MPTTAPTAPGSDNSPGAGMVVGFDLDLTLVDSRERIIAASVHAFAVLGAQVSAAQIAPYLGVPLTIKAAALAPQVDPDAFVAEYRSYYRSDLAPASPAMPGARAALEAVVSRGGRCLVVSAKYLNAVQEALREGQLDDLVEEVHGELFAQAKAVALTSAGASIYVGDHPGDVEAAGAAHALAVTVATGAHDATALRAAGADVVLTSLSEFPTWYADHLALSDR